MFDAEKLATIDRTLSELGHLNGAQLSALSHAEAGWRYRTDSETIPYSSAFVRLATPGPGTSALAKQALADLPPKIADRR